MTAKSRHTTPGGEAHYCAKLTEEDVREIRRLHSAGESYTTLALRFGVNKSGIAKVVYRETWKHVA
jgi:IS30 family transposase